MIPITRPAASSSAPPELPGEIAASTWMGSTSARDCAAERGICRLSAETIPAVTVPSKPRGLPIASTGSPGRGSSVRYSGTGSPPRAVRTTARSVTASVARTVPGDGVPSAKLMVTSVASPTTCWLVMTTTCCVGSPPRPASRRHRHLHGRDAGRVAPVLSPARRCAVAQHPAWTWGERIQPRPWWVRRRCRKRPRRRCLPGRQVPPPSPSCRTGWLRRSPHHRRPPQGRRTGSRCRYPAGGPGPTCVPSSTASAPPSPRRLSDTATRRCCARRADSGTGRRICPQRGRCPRCAHRCSPRLLRRRGLYRRAGRSRRNRRARLRRPVPPLFRRRRQPDIAIHLWSGPARPHGLPPPPHDVAVMQFSAGSVRFVVRCRHELGRRDGSGLRCSAQVDRPEVSTPERGERR